MHCFALASAPRLRTGEAAANAVFLDVDLPPVLILHPFCGICPFCHNNPPPDNIANCSQRCYNTVADSALHQRSVIHEKSLPITTAEIFLFSLFSRQFRFTLEPDAPIRYVTICNAPPEKFRKSGQCVQIVNDDWFICTGRIILSVLIIEICYFEPYPILLMFKEYVFQYCGEFLFC